VPIEFGEKEERKQEEEHEYRTERKTRSARNTDRKTARKHSIHTRHRLIETGNQRRNVCEGDLRETEAIIGYA